MKKLTAAKKKELQLQMDDIRDCFMGADWPDLTETVAGQKEQGRSIQAQLEALDIYMDELALWLQEVGFHVGDWDEVHMGRPEPVKKPAKKRKKAA